MIDYSLLNDDQLTNETNRLAGMMTYYNCAEGNWSKERAEREECKSNLSSARKEMESRNLVFNAEGFLL